MAAEQILDAGQGPAGCRDRQLLPGDLEQQRAVQVHRRQLDHPRPRVEVRPLVDQPRRTVWLQQARSYLRQADPVLARLIDERPESPVTGPVPGWPRLAPL